MVGTRGSRTCSAPARARCARCAPQVRAFDLMVLTARPQVGVYDCGVYFMVFDVVVLDCVRLQVRVFDFVVDKHRLFKSVPHSQHATYCHWSTVLFDHESETAVFDLVRARDHGAVRDKVPRLTECHV